MRYVPDKDELPISAFTADAIQTRIGHFSHFPHQHAPEEVKIPQRLLEHWVHSDVPKSPLDFIKRLYATVDIYHQHTITPLAVCRQGCAYCCTNRPVEVSAAEAVYIHTHTAYRLNRKAEPLRRYLPAVNTPCPFLDDHTAQCQIYAVRPLACRLLARLDHYQHCHSASTTQGLITVDSHPAFHSLTQPLQEISQQLGHANNMASVAEIRQWFPSTPVETQQ